MSTPTLSQPPAPTVWPSVGFTDVDAGIRLLTEVFGFVVTVVHRSDEGVVEHAEARWPAGGGIMFGSRGKRGDWGSLGPQGVYVVAPDTATLDQVWERVEVAEGLEVLRKLHDTDYGSRTFDVRDADGNLWSFGTYPGS
ncbi:VOC family protein [Allokutzneria multivorans]|uniref:VOC family protein n=1 Tax=Allokutzneria multivorans TaxID=1142134 RepID=A0ABP7T6Z2_9PSEU